MANDLYNPDSIGQSWSSAGSIDGGGGGSNANSFDWAAVGQAVLQYSANALANRQDTAGGFNFNIETPKERELRAELEARKEQQQTIFVVAILLVVGYLIFNGTK